MAMLATSMAVVAMTAGPARAAGIDRRTVITWNMQGEGLAGEAGIKWQRAREYMTRTSVLLLQEAGAGPPSSLVDDTGERIRSITRTTVDGDTYENSTWNPGTGTHEGGPYEVYFLQTDTNGGTNTGGRVNIAIVVRGAADQVRVVQNPVNAGRRALGVRFGQHWYFTFHGLSGGGGDSAAMLNAVDDHVEEWAREDGEVYRWAVGGDFNVEPDTLVTRRDFPSAAIYRTHQRTQNSGYELDYVVADQWFHDLRVRRLDQVGSDHWGVQVGPDQSVNETPLSRPVRQPVPARVMPAGDSISNGVNSTHGDGYRAEFEQSTQYKYVADDTGLLQKRDVDMVGSQRSGKTDGADHDHEGHPGYRIDQIARVLDCTVEAYRPNVVTLMAGTNDMNQDHELAGAPERLGALIDQILRDAPEATVLVATLVPSTKSGMQAKIDRYNAELPRIVEQRQRQGEHVRLVSMGELTTEDVDGSHPDDEGYRKVAQAFAEALLRVEDEGWLREPVPGTGSRCGDAGDPNVEEGSAAGPGWRALGVVAPGMTSPPGRTDLADIDGDGRDDYIRVPDNGRMRIALNTPAEPGKPHWVEVESDFDIDNRDEAESLRFADLTGDGRDDLVEVRPTGSSTEILIHYVNEGVRSGRVTWSGAVLAVNPKAAGVPREAVRFADVNGDRRDDYLRVGDSGAVHAYVNHPAEDGGYRFEEILNWAPGVSYGSRDKLRLADVNGDGKADYLMVGSTGAVHAYVNDGGRGGGGFTEHRYFVNETDYPGEKSTFRDISGDGKADYIVVYDGGAVRCWLNRGGNV
ncbi:lysophospholipase L1-like esterase [Streptomyces afghaniensis]|nr:lysophospholipase L1-like esterase [Streptomyces afghaniensis]